MNYFLYILCSVQAIVSLMSWPSENRYIPRRKNTRLIPSNFRAVRPHTKVRGECLVTSSVPVAGEGGRAATPGLTTDKCATSAMWWCTPTSRSRWRKWQEGRTSVTPLCHTPRDCVASVRSWGILVPNWVPDVIRQSRDQTEAVTWPNRRETELSLTI